MNKSMEVGLDTISLLKSGNRAAFDEVYHHYSSNLYLRILKMVKVQEVADELLQDVFLKVWLKRDLIDEHQPIKAWIYKIAQNCIYDHYRLLAKDAKMRQYLIDHYSELYNETEEYLLDKERRAVLNLALDRLPEKKKTDFYAMPHRGEELRRSRIYIKHQSLNGKQPTGKSYQKHEGLCIFPFERVHDFRNCTAFK